MLCSHDDEFVSFHLQTGNCAGSFDSNTKFCVKCVKAQKIVLIALYCKKKGFQRYFWCTHKYSYLKLPSWASFRGAQVSGRSSEKKCCAFMLKEASKHDLGLWWGGILDVFLVFLNVQTGKRTRKYWRDFLLNWPRNTSDPQEELEDAAGNGGPHDWARCQLNSDSVRD